MTPALTTLIETRLDALAHTQAQATTAYQYEKNFVEQWAALGREVFQASIGPVPTDRHQKKSPHQVRPHHLAHPPRNESGTSGL